MEIKLFDKSVETFIRSLEKSTIAKTLRTIEFLENFGNKLGMPYSKKIVNNIFEIRIRGAQEVRILYTFHKNRAVLLCGFLKKSKKTPHREIEKALQRAQRLD